MFAHNNPSIIGQLIGAGAEVNARGAVQVVVSPTGKRLLYGGETALHFAAAVNCAEAIRVLAEAGAEVEAQAENGLASLDLALKPGSPTKAAEALVAAGAELTPRRLAAMHASARRANSDLWEFPWATGESPEPNTPEESGAPIDNAPTHLESTQSTAEAGGAFAIPSCPNCETLLYSRRSNFCGSCGAKLPAQLILTDEQIAAQRLKRKWAQDLADGFGSVGEKNC